MVCGLGTELFTAIVTAAGTGDAVCLAKRVAVGEVAVERRVKRAERVRVEV